jgi:hypothetical protein
MAKKPRILLGTVEIVRQLYELSEAFRALGYEADTALLGLHQFYADLPYKYLLYQELPFPTFIQKSRHPLFRYPRGLLNRTYRALKKAGFPDFLEDYDVYVCQFGESLLPDNEDFPLLKARGKKIISIFQGSDIRHWSAAEPMLESVGLKAYRAYRQESTLNQTLAKLRMAERYADVIFFQPSYGELALRPYMHLYLAMNLKEYPHHVPGRDVPIVVHAPSNRALKGTAEILATLDRLKSEGVKFTLKLLEGLPNKEVIRQLADADLVVDELNEAHYGMLALEGLATGCAVAGGNHPALVPLPENRPIVPINPSNLYQQLHRLLREKSWRVELAHSGRPFVEKHHDRSRIARHMLDCLEEDSKRKYDYYPDYFARHYRLPDGEFIASDLKLLTAEIVQQHGLPTDVTVEDMVERGLIAMDGLGSSIPRWVGTTLSGVAALVNSVGQF